MNRLIHKILIILSMTLSLQACIFVAGAAAGAAAIAVVRDHRTIEKILTDTDISNQIYNRMRNVPALINESHIEIAVFNHVVLLTGETPSPSLRVQAESIAQSTKGVARVYNQITIEGPTSSLTRTSDAWITTKIKTQMLATEDLNSSSIKVVTENGVVFLMGAVKRDQAEIAVDIARRISGVQKVVKIFQYRN
jgi:osmotically-inducible protein OsmY